MVSSRLRSSAEAADRTKWPPGHRGVPAGRLAELGMTKSTQLYEHNESRRDRAGFSFKKRIYLSPGIFQPW